jgi:hypothetical protein
VTEHLADALVTRLPPSFDDFDTGTSPPSRASRGIGGVAGSDSMV